jgi:hypothetical protein
VRPLAQRPSVQLDVAGGSFPVHHTPDDDDTVLVAAARNDPEALTFLCRHDLNSEHFRRFASSYLQVPVLAF